jgi:hypothetical protein
VVVKNDQLVSGIIDGRSIGLQSESLLRESSKTMVLRGENFKQNHPPINNSSPCEASATPTTNLFSHRDTQPHGKTMINKKKIDEHIENFRNGTLTRLPGQTSEESFEIYVMHELAIARDESAK